MAELPGVLPDDVPPPGHINEPFGSVPGELLDRQVRETRKRIHSSNTSRSSSRQASSVEAFAYTPSKLGISPQYEPSSGRI
jgi:hypothetical protein